MKNLLSGAAARLRLLGWALGVLGLVLARPARAQTSATDPYNVNPAAPVVVRPDTATVRKVSKKEKRALAAADSAKRTERLFGLRVTRPQKAGFLALIPSAGQIYNKRYWKLPIVYGMVGGLGYWVYYQQNYFQNFRLASRTISIYTSATDQTAALAKTDLPADIKNLTAANISTGLIFARRYRDLSILLSGLGYSLQILDAVVDAHLHDFDVSDNLSLNWQPTLLPQPGQLAPAPGLSLSLRVKQGGRAF